jgi:hypothetical protein
MFKSLRIGAAGAAIAATLGMTSAAHAVTAQADATAEILETLTLTENGDLDFGVLAVNGADTITVAPNSGVTCGTNLICTGTAAAAQLDVTGSAGATVGVTLPSAAVHLTGPGVDMDLDTFTASASTLTLTGGAASFTVGGTLHVNAAQAAGTYTGQFDGEVEYQ